MIASAHVERVRRLSRQTGSTRRIARATGIPPSEINRILRRYRRLTRLELCFGRE